MMKYFEVVKGDRLYLSPLNINDAELYVKWLTDKEITQYLGNRSVLDVETEREWIRKNNNGYCFAIVLRDSDKLIGNCGFTNVDMVDRTAEIGIFIGDKEEQNKGYGREAMKILLNYGFNTLGLNNVMLKVYSFNEKAIRTYKKLGFKTFGVRRNSHYANGLMHDTIYMDMLRDEFNEIEDFIFIP